MNNLNLKGSTFFIHPVDINNEITDKVYALNDDLVQCNNYQS